ncbi:hypothetical protein L6452_08487 [Arctium lappa]|uniref:Uncharacterized protein n=1 Tax=Arctium lappa TaxID=4217 RepID=A0ACB9DHW0_ARCLA|nr:hypothetical protein L6452_08487 [Arctium lappa]
MAGDEKETAPNPAKIEPNSNFFLGPQDRPGDFITPTRLKGDNYDDWAGDIQTALEARWKFVFLDGTITKPEAPCTQADWNTINAMLISWIMNTIDPEVKCYLSKYKDPRKLWETLKSRYAVVNGPKIQQLKMSIAKCEQVKNNPVAEYFGKLSALWEELNNQEPLIECNCCAQCTVGTQHEKRRENGMLHEFLMGLNSEFYGNLRTTILSQEPLPSLDRAFQLVVQEERVRLAKETTIEKPIEAVGFTTNANEGRNRGRVDRPDRSHLTCYRSGNQARNGGRGRGNARTNVANASGQNVIAEPRVFSVEQWKTLAGLVGNAKVPSDRLNGPFEGADWNGD